MQEAASCFLEAGGAASDLGLVCRRGPPGEPGRRFAEDGRKLRVIPNKRAAGLGVFISRVPSRAPGRRSVLKLLFHTKGKQEKGIFYLAHMKQSLSFLLTA